MSKAQPFNIGMALYDGYDPLDIIGPYDAFHWMGVHWSKRTVNEYLIAESKEVRPFGTLNLVPNLTFADFHDPAHKAPKLDLIFVPGGDPSKVVATIWKPAQAGFEKEFGEQLREAILG
jgi:putative intracellular protease/amidase